MVFVKIKNPCKGNFKRWFLLLLNQLNAKFCRGSGKRQAQVNPRRRALAVSLDIGRKALHLWREVGKKLVQTGAQIVQARLTRNGAQHAVIGAFTPAILQTGAVATWCRKAFALGVSKLHLGALERHIAYVHD
jgi:hypothetical protein